MRDCQKNVSSVFLGRGRVEVRGVGRTSNATLDPFILCFFLRGDSDSLLLPSLLGVRHGGVLLFFADSLTSLRIEAVVGRERRRTAFEKECFLRFFLRVEAFLRLLGVFFGLGLLFGVDGDLDSSGSSTSISDILEAVTEKIYTMACSRNEPLLNDSRIWLCSSK